MNQTRILCLGAGGGWHSNELAKAAARMGCVMQFATYESLQANIESGQSRLQCEAGMVSDFDAILTRTMPAGSLEQISFRLAVLHAIDLGGVIPIVNRPRALEIAIDKFATLQIVSDLGYPVPDTVVVQSRSEAVDAFKRLGGDCIVKPIFGGEGRGVMRVCDPELAWTTFSTLENLGAVCYVQRFVAPGGCDTRLLVIGETIRGVRRSNPNDFRTNVSSGARCEPMEVDEDQAAMARHVCKTIGLSFASVDLLDHENDDPQIIEVNAIPGWKGAQGVAEESIAEKIIGLIRDKASANRGIILDG